MQYTEKGVLKGSTMNFHTPTTTALQYLFFLNYAGYFHCDATYDINRKENERYEPYLFMLVRSGIMKLNYDGRHFDIHPGHIMFIDSRREHRYYTDSVASFQFVHFGGNLSDYYFQRICGGRHYAFQAGNPEAIAACLSQIEEEADQKIMSEHLISAHIHMLLGLTLSRRENYASENARRVADCIKYMKEHLDQAVSLQDLSNEVHLSPFYLSRIFKRYTDSSPGEYLMNLRLSHAKMLLMSTSEPVATVAELCGFNSSVHFIDLFRKKIGSTPLQFRKTHKV